MPFVSDTTLVATVERSGGLISTKTAAAIATDLTVGLMAPISGQIDPIRLGRQKRAMEVASDYADRLGISPEAIGRLTTDYSDHGFVIDLTETKEFLDHTRALEPTERHLEIALASVDPGCYLPIVDRDIVACLTEPDPATIQTDFHPEEKHGRLPQDPAGEHEEAKKKDTGVRSAISEAHGPMARSGR